MAVEKLAGIKVPERAEYLRVIMAELQRICNHLIATGSFFNDCGAYFTPFLHMLREREKIIDLFEMVCGQRLTYNYMRIGGVSQDIPEEFLPAMKLFLEQMPRHIDEYDTFLKENEKQFGISVKKDLLTVDGKPMDYSRVYRKVQPVQTAALSKMDPNEETIEEKCA